MRKLKCFVASAFGHKDVDTIFTKVIKPALCQRKITPFRVDRVEHNDDIDDKIWELIDACDFCIADLTYARPSVYYEAGLFHGMGKPVIFISRSDHFKPKEDDINGNLRIHFDLQMKNIIDWANPTATFQERLGARVNAVTKPILKLLCENEVQKQSQADFARLPQKKKILTMLELAEKELKKMKFSIDGKRLSVWDKKYVHGFRETRKGLIYVCCQAHASLTKPKLLHIRSIPHIDPCMRFLRSLGREKMKNITSHVLCFSLRPTPETRIADALPYCHLLHFSY